MQSQVLKNIGFAAFVVCFILSFVAWQQYDQNSQNVAAMNSLMHASPFGGPLGSIAGNMTPGMPASTEYAVFFAIPAAIGGVYCMVRAGNSGDGRA